MVELDMLSSLRTADNYDKEKWEDSKANTGRNGEGSKSLGKDRPIPQVRYSIFLMLGLHFN
jgi:hypothetical protein